MKVYCKNCKYNNIKNVTYSVHYDSKHHGICPVSVKGCGMEKFDIKETKKTIKIIPYRNKDNDCELYKRKWYKFWVKH